MRNNLHNDFHEVHNLSSDVAMLSRRSFFQGVKYHPSNRPGRALFSLSQACGQTSKAAPDRFRDDKNIVESRWQPWKVVWPLKGHAWENLWSQSEYPEVTSWSFDAQRPFDRPWRTWTRSALAKSEKSFNACEEEELEQKGRLLE